MLLPCLSKVLKKIESLDLDFTNNEISNYGHDKLALEIANRWCNLNEKIFQNTEQMMEKYNVVDLTLEAGGGEYDVQEGFGWSNGVYLAMQNFIKTKRTAS